jgi:hypothetical protein
VFAAAHRARVELGFATTIGFEEGIQDFATAPLRAAPAAARTAVRRTA